MTELLFGLTIGFFGYVIYQAVKIHSESNRLPPPEAEAPLPAANEPTTPVPAEVPDQPAAPAKPESAPAAPQGDAERGARVRNPATGEVSPVPNNYRFAKKWIKEALVAEGLLDRVYKPGELDGVASDRVKAALEALKALDKYRP
jgi:hypothetical protein